MRENKGKKLGSEEKQGSQCREGLSAQGRGEGRQKPRGHIRTCILGGGGIASKGPKISVPEKGHRRHEKKSPVSNREASEATGEAGTVLQDSLW